jgi:hypothetical protein
MQKTDARDRLIASACRVVSAERGGLDHANADAEQELAIEMLDEATIAYASHLGMSGEDVPG